MLDPSMNSEQKVTADHLRRIAYLYIRQSTLRQVLEHTESTQRQYALRQRAIALVVSSGNTGPGITRLRQA